MSTDDEIKRGQNDPLFPYNSHLYCEAMLCLIVFTALLTVLIVGIGLLLSEK